ncbi:PilZ domain-containing protein [Nitrosomonas sp. Nm166]|uniref:PilZ domain-containing protein n=1 Tax=Nitrosomonas sp. Nm166 TaxID=1881054 RepID=UPI000B8676A7
MLSQTIRKTITNISTTGAEINATSHLGKLGTVITLSFTIQILDQEIPLSINSTIRSVKQLENDQRILCFGIEFTELESNQVFALHSLVYQEIVENPHRAA